MRDCLAMAAIVSLVCARPKAEAPLKKFRPKTEENLPQFRLSFMSDKKVIWQSTIGRRI
jgi:hypothetical protein